METSAEVKDRILSALRSTFWGSVASFVLSFCLIVCVFLATRLLGDNPVLDLTGDRVVLVLLALAFSISLQRPRSATRGLWAGVGTACVASAVGAGFCGSDSLQGSMIFLAVAPIFSGVILGLAQHDEALT